MANDPSKAELWPNADVLVAPLGSPIPATENDPFSAAWKFVGCLDGDAGFPLARAVEKSDKFFWGGGLLRSTRKNFKLTQKFTAFEGGNEVVQGLAWPGSTGSILKVPSLERILVAFEMREGSKVKRLITYYQSEVDLMGEIKDAESEVTAYEFEATFFAGADMGLIRRQPAIAAATLSSLALTGATTVVAPALAQMILTATYSDASTRDVTTFATWTSATPAKATVPYGSGVVKGVSAGTSVISAAYGGMTATQTITVS